ncbi:MAG: hypothetical protein LKG19_08090 [Saprospiraceae bacterium]|jgi:hypothetical protein|nr:hypothetical protein [Saprospiraceae bacterium]
MNKILLSILFVLFNFIANGTSIIIYITKNKIYVGADSRRVINKKDGDGVVYIDNVCKIKKIGNYWACISGTSSYDIFNPFEALDSLFGINQNNFENTKSSIHVIFKSKLAHIGSEKCKIDSNFRYIEIGQGVLIMTVCIIGNFNETLSVYKINYYYSHSNNKSFVINQDTIFNSLLTPDRNILTLGIDSEINKIKDLNKKMNHSPSKTIKNAVNLQSKWDSLYVNDKINLLVIRKNKFKWLLNHSCN